MLHPLTEKPLAFVRSEIQNGKIIYPAQDHIFHALDLTPIEKTKIVILGQDPYHGEGQAHGLAFSVPKGIKIPPSLKNIYKELQEDIGMSPPDHGNLEGWARQGVLLLNTTLTVEARKAASHQGRGWEAFTDYVIAQVNALPRGVVFMLWGSHAQKKNHMIDTENHLVLEAPHPSPLSAYKGFLGCRHFSKANDFLVQHGRESINWQDL